MDLIETIVLSLSLVSCVGICAYAYLQSQIKSAIIQQQGIDRRTAMKSGNTDGAYQRVPWWAELVKVALPELLKSPAIQNMITENAPALIAKMGGKQE
jgi:hypothetical protein